jgi:DNA-binding MarR family transcriptional regulator
MEVKILQTKELGITECQRILKSIENRKKRGASIFSYNDIAKEAEAYHSNVIKLIKSLERKGLVKRIGGKGIVGDPYQFEIIS